MFIATRGAKYDGTTIPFYPHTFDDLVFIIYQHGKLKDELPRTSAESIMQWLIFIFAAAIILFTLRETIERRKRRSNHRINNAATPDYFLGSFVDSMGIFLGVALSRIGLCRAERWFLISFSVFGLFFKMIYTEYLFAMFTAVDQDHITSIDQLFQANIPITVDHMASGGLDGFYIRT